MLALRAYPLCPARHLPLKGEISCGDCSFSHQLCTSGCCPHKDVRSKPLVDLPLEGEMSGRTEGGEPHPPT
ncbi:lytic murein transglycosylase [Agrobacterium sp. B1(2019)]|nr:lytic murein transglycosylase [Agrobacterium sp. B1(2019)]